MLTKFTKPLWEKLEKSRFLLRVATTFFLLLIDVLWAFLRFPGGRTDFSTRILFSYGPPTFVIIFSGILIGHLFGVDPSPELIVSWESVGIGVFLTIGGLQIAFMSVVENIEHIIQLAAMVLLDFLVSTLFILDLILTNKAIIKNVKLENSSQTEVSLNKIK